MTLRIAKGLFLLIPVALAAQRPLEFNLLGFRSQAADVIFAIVVLFWIAALVRKETKLRTDSIFIGLAVYAASMTLSAVFSVSPVRSFSKLVGEAYLLMLCIVAFNLAADTEFLRRLTISWICGAALTAAACVVGVVLFYAGHTTQADNYLLSHAGSLPAGNFPRLQALFSNANMMCNYLIVAFSLALLAARERWLGRAAAAIGVTAAVFSALLTISAGLGAIFLTSGLWLRTKLIPRGKATAARIILAFGVLASIAFFASALVSTDTQNTDADLDLGIVRIEPSVRVIVWKEVLAKAAHFPLIGQGTGIDPVSVRYLTVSGDMQLLADAHNTWLSVLGQTGIIGLVAFLGLNLMIIRRFRFGADAPAASLALSCAVLGSFFYHGLTGSFEDARHAWIAVGLLCCMFNRETGISEESRSPSPRPST